MSSRGRSVPSRPPGEAAPRGRPGPYDQPVPRDGQARPAPEQWFPVTAQPHVVTLLSRAGCHLCDDAREVIARVAAELDVPWEELDITTSDSHLRQYWDQIPVTLIDGVQHDFWHVSEERLRAALTR